MRSSLFVFATGLALLAATPSLALTVSSAPPSRDVAQRLNQAGASVPAPRDAWGGGRPQAGSNYNGDGTVTYGTTGTFGTFRSTVQPQPRDAWSNERRDSSSNPL